MTFDENSPLFIKILPLYDFSSLDCIDLFALKILYATSVNNVVLTFFELYHSQSLLLPLSQTDSQTITLLSHYDILTPEASLSKSSLESYFSACLFPIST